MDIYNGQDGTEWDVHQFKTGIVGLALANRINNKDIHLYGFQRENGLTLYTTGSTGLFGITEGIIWYGPNSTTVPLFDTTLDGYYTYIFHTSGSGWYRYTSSVFISDYYDNAAGSSSLTPCAPNSWSVNFVYRLIGTTDEAAIVMSSQQFATALEASNNAATPPNLPSTVRDQCLLVGRFVVQSGSIGTPTVESAFESTFIPALVTNHEDLLGLQGGQGGEHYHMTSADYTGTGTGVMVRQTNALLTSPTFAAATPLHIPYWSSQQKLTLTSSLTVAGNDAEYVIINSASFPDPTNPEALLVFQKNTASVNVVGAYATIDSFSQIYNQNFSSGSLASTDIIASNDYGNQYTHFIDVGIASSNYSSPTWPWTMPNDGYLMMDGGNLWIGTSTTHSIKFFINNTASVGYISSSGAYLTGSFYGTSSWAITASHAVASDVAYSLNFVPYAASSASWVSSSVYITNADTASYIEVANVIGTPSSSVSASYASASGVAYSLNFVPQTATSASWVSSSVYITNADTASYALGIPTIKSGIVAGTAFDGNPKTSSVVFTNPFSDNNYSVVVTGEASRTWTIQNKVSGSFEINANSVVAFTENVFWQAISTGEFYS